MDESYQTSAKPPGRTTETDAVRDEPIGSRSDSESRSRPGTPEMHFKQLRSTSRGVRDDQAISSLQYLRASDVCSLLRISKPTLWRMRRDGRFPPPTELTTSVIAWRRIKVEAWLADRTQRGAIAVAASGRVTTTTPLRHTPKNRPSAVATSFNNDAAQGDIFAGLSSDLAPAPRGRRG